MEKIVSQLDESGYFIGAAMADESPLEPEVFLIPGGAIDVAPPHQLREGVRFKLGPDLTWEEEEDHRTDHLYLTVDGRRYEIGRTVDQGSYDGAGPVPAWLTLIARPSPFYKWQSGEWVLDNAALAESVKAGVLAEKKARLAVATEQIAVLQDAVDIEIATEAEVAALTAWKRYRVELNRIEPPADPAQGVEWPLAPH